MILTPFARSAPTPQKKKSEFFPHADVVQLPVEVPPPPPDLALEVTALIY